MYVPLQYADPSLGMKAVCIDPRAPIYRAMRDEWKRNQRVTPRLLELETQVKTLTAEMGPDFDPS